MVRLFVPVGRVRAGRGWGGVVSDRAGRTGEPVTEGAVELSGDEAFEAAVSIPLLAGHLEFVIPDSEVS